MQRCHQQDLSGHLLEQGGWEHLCLPAEYEGSRAGRLRSAGPTRARNRASCSGPNDLARQEIESLKVSLGSYAAAGQLQQRPSPAGGGIYQAALVPVLAASGSEPSSSHRPAAGRHACIDYQPIEVPRRVDEQIQSWDCAFKDLETSDYVVGPGLGSHRLRLSYWAIRSAPHGLPQRP